MNAFSFSLPLSREKVLRMLRQSNASFLHVSMPHVRTFVPLLRAVVLDVKGRLTPSANKAVLALADSGRLVI